MVLLRYSLVGRIILTVEKDVTSDPPDFPGEDTGLRRGLRALDYHG